VGNRTKQNFFKGRSPNGQKTHEKMLTIPGYKENANPNHTKILPLLVEWLSSRTPPSTNVGKDVGKKEPSYTAGGNVH
jgi:hypothetical protein